MLYADDMTIFLKDTDSVRRLRYIFESFEQISGLKVNKTKTHFMWMGEDENKPDGPLFGNLVKEIHI